MKHYVCKVCGMQFEQEPIFRPDGKELLSQPFCDSCRRVEETCRQEMELRERQRELVAQWNKICPPLYRRTDPNDPRLSTSARDALREWQLDNSGMGVGIYGPTGRGKTRLAFLRLADLHFEGVRVFAVSSKRMEKAILDSFSDEPRTRHNARQIMERARKCRVLLLDDVGKEKFTERAAGEFYDLIETRTSQLRPTIWTANASAAEITSRMGVEHGAYTIRRLKEFSRLVQA